MAEIFYDKNALISTILIFRRMLFPSSHTGKINSYYRNMSVQQLLYQFIRQLRMF